MHFFYQPQKLLYSHSTDLSSHRSPAIAKAIGAHRHLASGNTTPCAAGYEPRFPLFALRFTDHHVNSKVCEYSAKIYRKNLQSVNKLAEMAPEYTQTAAGQKRCGSASCNLFYGTITSSAKSAGSVQAAGQIRARSVNFGLKRCGKVDSGGGARHQEETEEIGITRMGENFPISDSTLLVDPLASPEGQRPALAPPPLHCPPAGP